jgi:glutathione peroxidase
MKLLVLYISMMLVSMQPSSGFYEISFQTVDGTMIKTSAYQGKKVIIAVVSANAAGLKLVKYLDSVQKATPTLQAIAIPTGDFDGSIKVQDLKDLKKNISIVVTQPLKVKKANGAQQHPLFAWLTQATENKHFDNDVESEGQLFFVSGKGTLYSVLPNNVPAVVLKKVIAQDVIESTK